MLSPRPFLLRVLSAMSRALKKSTRSASACQRTRQRTDSAWAEAGSSRRKVIDLSVGSPGTTDQWSNVCMQNAWPWVCVRRSVSNPLLSTTGMNALTVYSGEPGFGMSWVTWPGNYISAERHGASGRTSSSGEDGVDGRDAVGRRLHLDVVDRLHQARGGHHERGVADPSRRRDDLTPAAVDRLGGERGVQQPELDVAYRCGRDEISRRAHPKRADVRSSQMGPSRVPHWKPCLMCSLTVASSFLSTSPGNVSSTKMFGPLSSGPKAQMDLAARRSQPYRS